MGKGAGVAECEGRGEIKKAGILMVVCERAQSFQGFGRVGEDIESIGVDNFQLDGAVARTVEAGYQIGDGLLSAHTVDHLLPQ